MYKYVTNPTITYNDNSPLKNKNLEFKKDKGQTVCYVLTEMYITK